MSTPSAKISVSTEVWEVVNSGIQAGTVPSKITEVIDLQNGTTDGSQIDKCYCRTESGKAASSTTSYDLAGVLLDIDGNVVTFAEVVLIAIRNKRTTAGATLVIGPATANGFGILGGGKGFWQAKIDSGGGDVVGPALSSTQGAWHIMYDPTGVPVTAATADILAVLCSATVGDTNSWDIVILGRSA